MKKAKVILLGLVAVIVIGGLLLFAGPAPEIEKGIGPLQPVYIGLSALAGGGAADEPTHHFQN